MKNLILISLSILSIILIFLSQKSFYSGPVKTVYKYDGDYRVGGDRFDNNDKKLESFTYHSYLNNGRLVVEEVDLIYHTFWGKIRGALLVLSIISSVILITILILFNKEKFKKLIEYAPITISKEKNLKNIKSVKLYEYVIKSNVSHVKGKSKESTKIDLKKEDSHNTYETIQSILIILFCLCLIYALYDIIL